MIFSTIFYDEGSDSCYVFHIFFASNVSWYDYDVTNKCSEVKLYFDLRW